MPGSLTSAASATIRFLLFPIGRSHESCLRSGAGSARRCQIAGVRESSGPPPGSHDYVSALAQAVSAGTVNGRLWFYSNYHCNLQCSYCLTESGPLVRRRELARDTILARAAEARDLGFTGFGVTGDEPFVRDDMAALAAELGRRLPTVVLSNATLFNERRLRELEPLADLPVQIQISLDRADPAENDEMRGPENFRKVIEAIQKLVERGIGVRVATTLEDPDAVDPEERERLCELHRSRDPRRGPRRAPDRQPRARRYERGWVCWRVSSSSSPS